MSVQIAQRREFTVEVVGADRRSHTFECMAADMAEAKAKALAHYTTHYGPPSNVRETAPRVTAICGDE